MTQRAFCLRLMRGDCTATHWLAYHTIEIDGRLIRVVLQTPRPLELKLGESLVLETPAASARVTLQSVIDDEVLVLRLGETF